MSTTTIRIQAHDRLTPSTREALHMAQCEAVRMNATGVDPEHLFLGLIMQGDERVIYVLSRLRVDVQTIRARVAETSQAQSHVELDESELPLSKEAQECLSWALAFTSYMHASSVFPDHLLLGVLRHQRIQPLLSFLLLPGETLQTRISEVIGPPYTSFMDQLIATRVRDQSVVSYGRGAAQRVLRRFERPGVTFIDVVDLDRAKRELREVVEFLKAAPTFQGSGGKFPHGVLLVGSTGNDRRALAHATAGEAIVPLISLSMLALVEMLTDLHKGALRIEDLQLPVREYNLLKRGSVPEKGQRFIQYLFQEAKNVSPSILFIEDIDAIARLESKKGVKSCCVNCSSKWTDSINTRGWWYLLVRSG
jgi:ATPase family protein associated with various cellular activities (AAA)/ClpA/ClpB-like protein